MKLWVILGEDCQACTVMSVVLSQCRLCWMWRDSLPVAPVQLGCLEATCVWFWCFPLIARWWSTHPEWTVSEIEVMLIMHLFIYSFIQGFLWPNWSQTHYVDQACIEFLILLPPCHELMPVVCCPALVAYWWYMREHNSKWADNWQTLITTVFPKHQKARMAEANPFACVAPPLMELHVGMIDFLQIPLSFYHWNKSRLEFPAPNASKGLLSLLLGLLILRILVFFLTPLLNIQLFKLWFYKVRSERLSIPLSFVPHCHPPLLFLFPHLHTPFLVFP